jgi:hypothetical protein
MSFHRRSYTELKFLELKLLAVIFQYLPTPSSSNMMTGYSSEAPAIAAILYYVLKKKNDSIAVGYR